jgi:hypothetical protein
LQLPITRQSFAFFILTPYFLSVAGRLFLVCGALVVLLAGGEIARGEGGYQSTRDGKTLVWNSDPKPGDVATWSGDRDRNDYAHGFGRLVWYTKETGFDKPQLYARYWGRLVDGKLEGPVNVHSKRKTHYAIFIDGTRVTGWANGTAPSRATAHWSALVVAKRNRTKIEPEPKPEPEAPAAGPAEEKEEGGRQKEEIAESIRDLYNERWPKIDIDDSLRLLAFPPSSLRKQ